MPTQGRVLRPTLLESAYVVVVATVATVGFVIGSSAVIVLAALLALPASVVAGPAYYVAYGLLAQLPGANPSRGTGSASCTVAGDCRGSASGAAGWFTATADVVGVLALVAAAVLNVVVLRSLAARRATAQVSAGPGR